MTVAPVALTLGDPAGIGPEIAAKAWAAIGADYPFFVIGDAGTLEGVPVATINHPDEAAGKGPDTLPVLHRGVPAPVVPGRPDHRNAQAVIGHIEEAVRLMMAGDALALTTNPISKQVLIEGAGFAFPGHTEFLAHLSGAKRPVMMLAAPELKVVPVTIHMALKDVPTALSPNLLEETLRIAADGLIRDFECPNPPRIAVAGLNPHAGEGGQLGHEDRDVITPVLKKLRGEGFDLTGPLSADTMFHDAARETYDVAVCMYHDQALIPLKTLNFRGGVNVTLGLPFVRTSPDHGTAFAIAGQGVADPTSLIAALRLAHDIGARRGT